MRWRARSIPRLRRPGRGAATLDEPLPASPRHPPRQSPREPSRCHATRLGGRHAHRPNPRHPLRRTGTAHVPKPVAARILSTRFRGLPPVTPTGSHSSPSSSVRGSCRSPFRAADAPPQFTVIRFGTVSFLGSVPVDLCARRLRMVHRVLVTGDLSFRAADHCACCVSCAAHAVFCRGDARRCSSPRHGSRGG